MKNTYTTSQITLEFRTVQQYCETLKFETVKLLHYY